MIEWKTKKLENVVQLVKNAWRVGDDEMPYIGLEHIEENRLKLKSIGCSTIVTSNKYVFTPDSFLFGKLRPYFRKLVRPNFTGICSTDIWVVRPKEENDKDFLFYFFSNPDFVNLVSSSSSGTRMPRADWTFISKQEWKFPSLSEQKAIAEVLLSLDDIIDLLRHQNEAIEEMIETLFRQWFVEEQEYKDLVYRVCDYADHYKKNIHPNNTPNVHYFHYSIPSFDNGRRPVREIGESIKSGKYGVETYSILFSKLNPHKDKRIWLILDDIEENSICSTEFQVIKPKDRKHLFFLYGWLNYSKNYNEIAAGVGGTSGSHQRISPQAIFNYDCPRIDDSVIERYNDLVEPLFNKQVANRKQILLLENMRDLLIPKLISGELRVNINK